MVFLVEEPSTGDLIYLINDTPTGSSSGMPAGQTFETRPSPAVIKHFQEPKAAYVADWDDLPGWQQETDADIFERIEAQLAAHEAG